MVKNNLIIPKGWTTSRLDTLCDVLIGGTPSRNEPLYWDIFKETQNIWVSIADLSKLNTRYISDSKEYLSDLGVKKSNTKLIPKGTVLMSFKLSIGKMAIAAMPLYTNEAIAAFKIKNPEAVSSDFLYYKLPLLDYEIDQAIKGKTLNKEKIAKAEVLLPTYLEQKKITEILGAVDKEIEKVDEIIVQTEKLKKGLIIKLFSEHKGSKKFKIKDISEVTSSKRVMVSDYVEGGIPFYRSTEIIKKSKNIPVINPYYISLKKFNFFKNRFGAPEAGDLLITAVGTIGDVYLVKDETFYFKDGNSVWVRKIKDTVVPEYLRMILSSSFYREKLNSVAGGSSQKALTIQKLDSIEVPIPSIKEQENLIKILSSIEKKSETLVQLKEKHVQLKKGLMSDLLSGKVRVIN